MKNELLKQKVKLTKNEFCKKTDNKQHIKEEY